MTDQGFAVYLTAIGHCGIAWGPGGLLGLDLPASSAGRTRTRLAARFPTLAESALPPAAKGAVDRITAYLAGAKDDFADLPLDWSRVGAFDAAVYRAAMAIPAGSTITYGALAAGLGDAGKAQAVGQALGRNPWPIVVPCHRITAADGRTGGFTAPGGTVTKLRLLEIEGALAVENLPLFGRF